MGVDMILIIAHSHAVGRNAYFTLVKFLKIVVCKPVKGRGHVVKFRLLL